jgi:hypothetical protein
MAGCPKTGLISSSTNCGFSVFQPERDTGRGVQGQNQNKDKYLSDGDLLYFDVNGQLRQRIWIRYPA